MATFNDLCRIFLHDFQHMSGNSTPEFLEVGRLSDRARGGGFAVSLKQSAGSRPLSSRRVPTQSPGVKKTARPPNKALSETPDDQTIFIPLEARGKRLPRFPDVSVRLQNVLAGNGLQLFGDLHGLSFSEIRGYRNCGKKTLNELRELVREIQHSHQTPGEEGRTNVVIHEASPPVVPGAIFVPTQLHELNLADLPLSGRLESVLKRRGVNRLGDVHGVSIRDLRGTKNCGKQTISELVRLIKRAEAGEFSAAPDATWNAADLVRTLDALVADLPDRHEEILVLRLGGRSEGVPTLEEVGAKYGLTRERVRQIVKSGVDCIRKHGGPRLWNHVNYVKKVCIDKVLPLTPALLMQWLDGSQAAGKFTPAFYVRLLAELKPTIPAWPAGQDLSASRKGHSEEIECALEAALRQGFQAVPLPHALGHVRTSPGQGKVEATELLAALQHSRRFKVEFPKPDAPTVRLARRSVLDVAKAILQESDAPLTPEQILDRARSRFGNDAVPWSPLTAGNALGRAEGFYLLGPRSYGLRQHFSMAEEIWPQIRADFRALLEWENRQISTAEVVNSSKFDWAAQTNTYELACILREDDRLIDLGKFLFALTEWGIEEREYIKDLIPKVLEKAGRPLTGTEVLERLQKLRSVSPTCIASALRKHPAIRDYGFGHYGLKAWGDSVKSNIVADTGLVERVIRRATPPLTFARLAEILDSPTTGELGDKLWQTCAALRDVLRLPEERSPETRLIHRSCRLERALVATAREVNRPLPLYEFQWELNERFGPLFASKSSEELRRALEQSQLFLRNAKGEFILDVHLEQLGLDADSIRHACAEILSESKEIVGCEDLLERLEADGKVWEELSPDILASLLRDDAAFQEVGPDRFRVKTCKH